MSGTLFVVATPIGNLEDITIRALRVLRTAAVIAAEDTRRTAHLLARHGITTPTTSLHEHNESKKAPALIARLLAGEHVALVSDAGTPTVSDPGSHLIREAVQAGVTVEPVPGPSAAIAALSVSGLSAQTFAFFGFPPIKPKDRDRWFGKLLEFRSVAIFFEAPHRIRGTLGELLRRAGDLPILVTRELTKIHEELVRGPISKVMLRLAEERGEYTVVLDLGQITINDAVTGPSPDQLLAEFSHLTTNDGSTRRHAVSMLARKHGLKVNDIYAALEAAKKIGQKP
jgi:16S rRNA (cytidine1402-2'-O)-methyltransferase